MTPGIQVNNGRIFGGGVGAGSLPRRCGGGQVRTQLAAGKTLPLSPAAGIMFARRPSARYWDRLVKGMSRLSLEFPSKWQLQNMDNYVFGPLTLTIDCIITACNAISCIWLLRTSIMSSGYGIFRTTETFSHSAQRFRGIHVV